MRVITDLWAPSYSNTICDGGERKPYPDWRERRSEWVYIPWCFLSLFNKMYTLHRERKGDIMQSDNRMIYTTDDVSGAQSLLCSPSAGGVFYLLRRRLRVEILMLGKFMRKHTHTHTALYIAVCSRPHTALGIVCLSAAELPSGLCVCVCVFQWEYVSLCVSDGTCVPLHEKWSPKRYTAECGAKKACRLYHSTTTTMKMTTMVTRATYIYRIIGCPKTVYGQSQAQEGNHVADAPLFYEIVFQKKRARSYPPPIFHPLRRASCHPLNQLPPTARGAWGSPSLV